jgi:hypothetical protein
MVLRLSSWFPRALWWPMVVAALLRVFCALWSPGFAAMDCYFHVLDPAWRWLSEPDAPMPSTFRSAVLPLVLHAVMRVARTLGVPDGAPLVNAAFVFLGLLAVTNVPLTYHLARARLSERAALAAAWLVAVQFLMPHTTSRALVECVASPPVVACLLCVERGRISAHPARWALACGLLLGSAGLVRLHVGVLLPVLLVWWWQVARTRAVAALVAGGGVMALVQGVVDLVTQGGFLVVPFRYAAYQRNFVNSYGESPWYVFVLMFAALAAPPFLAGYLRAGVAAARRHPTVSVSFVVFLVVHSMVGHKEERFMFTVLPLFFIILGAALADAWDAHGWRRACVVGFGVLNTAALVLFTLASPRQNALAPLMDVRGKDAAAVHGAGVRLPQLYAGMNTRVVEHASMAQLLADVQQERGPRVRLLVAKELGAPDQTLLDRQGWRCGGPQEWPPDVLDGLLLAVNPKNNQSRQATTSWDCVRAP